MEWLTATGNAPFAVAILVMLGLAMIELVALVTGFSVNDLVDEFVVSNGGFESQAQTGMEATAADAQGVVGRFLSWLYIGRVPVLMVLISWLTIFGLAGLMLQGILRGLIGWPLPAIFAVPGVLVLTLPVVRGVVGGIARILPRDESSAVSVASFVGRTAVISGGTARKGMPAQARLTDQFKTTHYILVEPDDVGDVLEEGQVVLVVRQIGGARFAVIRNPNAALIDGE